MTLATLPSNTLPSTAATTSAVSPATPATSVADAAPAATDTRTAPAADTAPAGADRFLDTLRRALGLAGDTLPADPLAGQAVAASGNTEDTAATAATGEDDTAAATAEPLQAAWALLGLPLAPAVPQAGVPGAPGVATSGNTAQAGPSAVPGTTPVAAFGTAQVLLPNTARASIAPATPATPGLVASLPVAASAASTGQSVPAAPNAAAAAPAEGGKAAAGKGTPPAALADAGWPGSTQLGPEAAAVRERSTAAAQALDGAALAAAAATAATADDAPRATATGAAAPASAHAAPGSPQALAEALGERLQWQLQRGSERAVIRLDPPMQGQLEIVIRRDGGTLQVHLTASNADVARQLQAIGDTLRQDLSTRQAGEVSVVVTHGGRDGDAAGGRGGRDGQAGQDGDHQAPGRALAEADAAGDTGSADASARAAFSTLLS